MEMALNNRLSKDRSGINNNLIYRKLALYIKSRYIAITKV
jgi:hypothetical protein